MDISEKYIIPTFWGDIEVRNYSIIAPLKMTMQDVYSELVDLYCEREMMRHEFPFVIIDDEDESWIMLKDGWGISWKNKTGDNN